VEEGRTLLVRIDREHFREILLVIIIIRSKALSLSLSHAMDKIKKQIRKRSINRSKTRAKEEKRIHFTPTLNLFDKSPAIR